MKKISLPKIGIHPVISGRRMGVRESLEEQTMNMAKATAALVTEKLRHARGAQIECVIADTCVASMAESAAYEERFSSQNVGVAITATPCWCYSSETIDTDPMRPKVVWGFNDTEHPGMAYLATALAAHSQEDLPAFSIYGHDAQDADDTSIPADIEEKPLRFARVGLAAASMRGKSYLSIDGVSMDIAGSIVDYSFFESRLGMKMQVVDMAGLCRRIDQKIYDGTELEMALVWADKNFRYGEDQNVQQYKRNAEQSRAVLKGSPLMAIYIRDMMQGNKKLIDKDLIEGSLGYNTIVAGFQGQRRWTDQYPNGGTTEALLSSSFDWDGVREPFVVATEDDNLNGMAMPFGHQLTGTAQVFANVRTYWSPEAVKRVTSKPLTGLAEHDIIYLINSGFAALDGSCKQHDGEGEPTMKPHWKISQKEANKCLTATEWCPAVHEYFRGGGYSFRFLTEGGMPSTMGRISIVKGLGPMLQITEGWSMELSKDMHDQLDARTNSTWPTTWFTPRSIGKGSFSNVYSVMANWGTNHGVLTIGHVGADFIALAAMLRVPVYMHNVGGEKIYRPSSWTAHDMDMEGQDYHAYQNYGPLYER